MATSTTIVIAGMKKMMDIFSINMSNRFDELNMKLIKLDLHLTDIERQRCPKAHESTTEELEEETKRIMEDIGHAFLKRKSKRPRPSPRLLILCMSWQARCSPQLPHLWSHRGAPPTPTTTTPLSSSPIIINSDNDDDDYTNIEPCLLMLTGALNSEV